MASLKPMLRNEKETGKSTIFIRISHDGKTRYIKTSWEIETKYMNPNGTINTRHPDSSQMNLNLNLLTAEYNSVIQSIGKEIIFMDINTIVAKLKRHQENGESIIKYFNERIETLYSENRDSYADTYKATVKWLKEYSGKDEVLFKEINLDFLTKFEKYLKKAGKKVNTIRIYLNNIRAVFNHAIDNDIIKIELFPFRKFKVDQEETDYRNLTVLEIKKLLIGPYTIAQQKAVHIWLLSFYLIGMNLKDLLYLTKDNIKKGRIIYKRFKTRKKVKEKLSVKITPEALHIIELYKGNKYLLDLLDENDSYTHFKTVTWNINARLKLAGASHGIKEVTTYYARHSWATIASGLNIPQETISRALGHTYGSKTTGIYIDYDIDKVDKANRSLIDLICE